MSEETPIIPQPDQEILSSEVITTTIVSSEVVEKAPEVTYE